MSILGEKVISKAGFSLAEMLVAMLIVSVVMAASLPFITLRKTNLGTHKQTDACIVDEAGNASSDACQQAIADCKYNRGNSCATVVLLTLNPAYANTAKSVLNEACTAGGEKACDYFIEQCAESSANCSIDGTNANDDLRHFLAINANDTGRGKAYIYNKVKKWFTDQIPNIEAEVIAACTAYPNSIACKILSQKIYNFNRYERDDFTEENAITGTTFNDGVVTLLEQTDVTYGDAYCWGRGEFGELGDENLSTHDVAVPAIVHGDITFSYISLGNDYGCGIEQGTNDAYCWGNGSDGKLGDNIGGGHEVGAPTLVQGNKKFSFVAAGVSHTCGIELTTNDAYCWGSSADEKLGDNDGAAASQATPYLVQGSKKFSSISPGEFHTCGIEVTTNDAYCWGRGVNGRLGDGNTTAHFQKLPYKVDGHDFFSISAGNSHTCAIEVGTNDAYCWGLGDDGRLGDNNENGHSEGTPVSVGGGHDFSSISAGADYTCGIEANTNLAYCWGSGGSGQLGDNNTNAHAEGLPVAVQNNHQFSSLDTGNFLTVSHTCAVEITTNDAYCWGDGDFGQLGDTVSVHESGLPVLVQGGLDNSFIGVGFSHTCAITPDTSGAAASYVTTTNTNQVAGATKVLSVVITQTSDANSPVKWLVSFDGRTTWKKMTSVCESEAAALDFSTSNTATEIQNWVKGCDLAAGTFDLAMDLQSTDGVTFPTVDKVLINYY
ncbi:MAG: hypothetical protein A2Y25_11720 [Candidatus Melainabacteria bacterium GWF2_37_15]|nr:MAG: hypothetical protein A2Y25_11720 [Candidatus Melainabacteria bacterium GWF2_37_15]